MFQLNASLFCLFICCLLTTNSGQQLDVCHRHSSKPGLHWSDLIGPADLVIGWESQWVDIICCTSNFREIVWYQSTDNVTWREFMSISNTTRKISKELNGQMVSITGLNRQTDSGSYKCVAHGYNGETIENIAVMEIRNFSEWSFPPRPLNPLSNWTDLEARRQDTVDIVCSSISGVDCDESFCRYGWDRLHPPFGDYDYDQIPVTTNASIRVRFTKEFSRSGLLMEAVLHIESVTDDDYNARFLCFAGNINGDTYDRIVRLNPPSLDTKIPVGVAAAGGILLVIVVLLTLVNYRVRTDLDVRIWWTKRSLKKRSTQDASADYDVALLSSGREPFAFYIKQTLQRDFNLKVFSEDELNYGFAPISCVPEGAKRSRSVLVVMTPEVHEDKEFLAIVSETISDATPVFIQYRMDSSDMNTYPPRLDRNITGALEVRPPLRWPGRVCDRVANPSDGPDSLDEELIAKYWEGSGSRQVKNFWKELQLSLVLMEKRRVVSSGKVRTDSVSAPLLASPGAVQHDGRRKDYSSVNV